MNFKQLKQDAGQLLDLRPDGRSRDIHFDLGKLTEEVGEVAECLNKSRKTKEDLAEELSDVLVVVGVLALKSGIDLEETCPKKQVKRVNKLVNRFHGGVYPKQNGKIS